jgi:hypothetical protein
MLAFITVYSAIIGTIEFNRYQPTTYGWDNVQDMYAKCNLYQCSVVALV